MSTPEPVWFVTGASTGMGLETARAALDTGARVVATSRDPTAYNSRSGRATIASSRCRCR